MDPPSSSTPEPFSWPSQPDLLAPPPGGGPAVDSHRDSPSAAPKFGFPPGFLFGAATSAHQVEGNCTHNDWWAWEEAGKVPKSGLACDHYRRFREDFDLARQLGHNAHRFSLEWSRIEPEPGVFSDEAIEHYREVLLALRERALAPVVTLYHFTLPRWVSERGGWENPEIVGWFERFTQRVIREYHGLARWWITLNEPLALVYKAYLVGEWPPGKKDERASKAVIRNMLRAHVRAYQAIHAQQRDAGVSIAHHALALSADDQSRLRDRLSLRARNFIVNHMVLRSLHRGVARIPGVMWERLSPGRTLDFIGLNYYTRDFVRNAGFDLAGLLGSGSVKDHHLSIGSRNSLGWEVYPEGMEQLLLEYRRYGLPILVSENGICTQRDASRWPFIHMHLWHLARALSMGVHVIGYLYWSLLDNFEWAEGYKARFGLVDVDYATQERRVRPSALHYREVIRRNRF